MLGEGLLSLPCLFIGLMGLQRHTLAPRFPWVLIPVQQSRAPLSRLPVLHFSNGYNHVARQQYISYTSSSVVDTSSICLPPDEGSCECLHRFLPSLLGVQSGFKNSRPGIRKHPRLCAYSPWHIFILPFVTSVTVCVALTLSGHRTCSCLIWDSSQEAQVLHIAWRPTELSRSSV